MTQNVKISVIVPVYNVEKYIDRCICSILNQSYQEIEVLLIDDGSTDHSGEICEMYAKRDCRIIVHHKENEGLSEARNVGMRLASGMYIVFIDSDDYIEQDMLETLYYRMQKDKSDLAICNFSYVNEEGHPEIELNKDMPIKDEVISGAEAFERLADEKYWYYVTAVNKLYKKDVFSKLLFPKGKFHEDEYVAHFVLDSCQRVSCIRNALYKYVQREGSITQESFSVRRLDGVDALCERIKFVLENKKNGRVAVESLAKAESILLEGYRRLGKDKMYRHVLKEKRILCNKAYMSLLFYKLGMKKRLKATLILIHPYVALKMCYWFQKSK